MGLSRWVEIENYRDRCNKERRDVTIYRGGSLGSNVSLNRTQFSYLRSSFKLQQPTMDIISMTHTVSVQQRLTLLRGEIVL